MAVITISRGSQAGAKLVAEAVASKLRVPCISRDHITSEAAQAAGVSEEVLTRQMERPPSFFDRHAREREVYLCHVRAALLQHAVKGSFVYHGHGGHFMLADIPNLIRVRVVAPMKFRVAAVMESQGLDATAAENYVHWMDRHREKWVRFLYGVDWQDPSFYDLIVNVEKLSIEEACEVLTQVARLERFAWTEESKQKVADVALVARVTAEFARSGELFNGRLELAAKANILTIGGSVRSERAREDLRAAAEKAIGEAELCFEVTLHAEDINWGFEHSRAD
jgi:cytidylate kinase